MSGERVPPSMETQQLLANAQSGSPGAVDALLDRHRESLRRMVRTRMDQALNRRIDASDVVQDVLLEASQRLKDYLGDPRMPFALWLRHIAQDRIIDLHRRHRLAARRSLDREQPLSPAAYQDKSSFDLAAQLRDRDVTPAAATLKKELEGQFLVALEKMTEDDRDLLLMRHFEGLSNSDVAEVLGLTPSAAGMRHLRALRRLRQIIGEPESASGIPPFSAPDEVGDE